MPGQEMIKLLPGRARIAVYVAFGLVGILLGAMVVGYGAAEHAVPEWLTVALAVYAFLGGQFGWLASNNVTDDRSQNGEEEK